ncbi:MAG: glycosyltransferase family 4 protein [Gemmatimonadota bacterium]
MRILFLAPHPFFQPRGTPLSDLHLVEEMCEAGHEVDVLTFHEGDDVSIPGCRILRIRPVPGVHDVRPGFSLKKVICDTRLHALARERLRAGGYDYVHAVEESAFIARSLGRRFGLPYVFDMDSSMPEQICDRRPFLAPLRPLLRRFEQGAMRDAVAVVAVCRDLEEKATAVLPPGRVFRIEDTTLLSSGPTGRGTTVRLDRGEGLAMYVGNLESYQGIDLLLDAFAVATKTHPGLRLAIVGGIPEHIEAHRARAAGLGIQDAVRFVGPRPVEELRSLLEQADVLVSPRTQGTNTPMKIFSYLDSGVPVLATRRLTHTQVLDDEIACLVETRPDALAAGLLRLLEDPDYAADIGRRARERARREFSREAYGRKVRRFLQSVEAEIGRDRNP